MSNVLLVSPEKPDVVITVKLGHLILSRFVGPGKIDELVYYLIVVCELQISHIVENFTTPVDLHLSVESIVEEQVVGHPHAVGLHWVTLAIIKF